MIHVRIRIMSRIRGSAKNKFRIAHCSAFAWSEQFRGVSNEIYTDKLGLQHVFQHICTNIVRLYRPTHVACGGMNKPQWRSSYRK